MGLGNEKKTNKQKQKNTITWSAARKLSALKKGLVYFDFRMINLNMIRTMKELYDNNKDKRSTKDHFNVLQHTVLNEEALKNLYVSFIE